MVNFTSKERMILVDAHVHIYNCFDLRSFFNSALSNFSKEATRNGNGTDFEAILILTDWSKENWFQYLLSLTEHGHNIVNKAIDDWSFLRTNEDISIYARRFDGKGLFVIAGRKIITSENLEVLAIATDRSFDDGMPLKKVLYMIKENAAIPVIPWAVGKWMGKRGKIIKELLEEEMDSGYFVCDNGNRPTFWPRPTFFDLAEKKGIRVLAGSDPLHFASESYRVGSFANTTHGTIDPDYPAMDLKKILLNPETRIQTYGKLEKPVRFFRNQLAMQYLKRKNRQKLVGE